MVVGWKNFSEFKNVIWILARSESNCRSACSCT